MSSFRSRSTFNRRQLLQTVPLTAAAAVLASQPVLSHAAPALRAQETPKVGGTVIVALPVDVVNYDPFLAGSTHGYVIARGLYNTLTRYDETLTPQPELATDWSFSDDGLQLTLNLRPGVKFHSGRDFIADDVLFSLDAAKNKEYAALIRALVTPITAEAPDAQTVVLTTATPYPAIFDALDGLFIVDPETAVPGFAEVGIGTGPFKQGERIPGDYARFDRFDDYWGGPAPLDSFELRPTPETASMAIAFETRTVDVAWRLAYRDYTRFSEDSAYIMSPGAPAALFYDITINTTHPVLSDNRVRQAVNWAIDRARFVNVVLLDIVQPVSVPFPAASIAFDAAQNATYAKDLEKAKALLAEAGHPDGFSARITTSTNRNPGMIELAQILQADLATIGVTLEIVDLEPAVYDESFRASDFDLAVHTFGRANKDPATLFGGAVVWYTDPETNPSKFDDPEYASLVETGATTIDEADRKTAYHAVTDLILDQSFTIPVAEQPRVWGLQSDVKNFVYSPDNMPLWSQVWLDR